jgi:signal transduction histidine kinase
MKPDGKTRRTGTPSGAGRHARGPHLAALTRINHDLRSPLSVILGVLELLEASTSLR